jgi:GntR family transcriptional repressor for pyruvate dehydrogenase complex
VPTNEGSDELQAAAFPAIERHRASDAVLRALVDGIRGGIVELGQRLPRAEDLAEHFGVGRLVVREALEQLRRAGVVEIRRGSGGGVFLRAIDMPTALLTDRSGLDRGELRELLEARRSAEMTCAAMGAARVSDADVDELARLSDALHGATDNPADFIELDVRFHLRLAAVAGNGVLGGLLGIVFRDLALVRERYPVAYGSMQAAIALQEQTVESVASRDAARLLQTMDDHLRALEQHFLGEGLTYPGP